MTSTSFFNSKSGLLLAVSFSLLTLACSQNSSKSESETQEAKSTHDLKWLIKKSGFNTDLTEVGLDSLLQNGWFRDRILYHYEEHDLFYATIASGDEPEERYDFVMVDEERGLLLMYHWLAELIPNQEGLDYKNIGNEGLKLFEVVDGEVVDRTAAYIDLTATEKPFSVDLNKTNPKELILNGNTLVWDGKEFKSITSFSSDPETGSYHFNESYQVNNVNQLINAFEQEGVLSKEIVDLLYPPKLRLSLFEEYIGTPWDGSPNTLNIDALEAHDTYTTGDYTLLHYSLPIWQTEGLKGKMHIVRVMKERYMLMEFAAAEGKGFGAMPSSQELSINLVPGGFVKVKKDLTHFPGTMMWNEATNLAITTDAGSRTEEYLGIKDDKAISYYQSQSSIVEFSKAAEIEEQIKNGTTPETLLSEGISSKEDLETSEFMALTAFLLKLKIGLTGDPEYSQRLYKHEEIMEALDLKYFELKYALGDVGIYQVANNAGKEAVVFFNTLNHVHGAGDAEDDIYQQLLNIENSAPHFCLISGTVQDIKDITGDENPEIIINSISTFRNDSQGNVGVYQINSYHELVQVDLPYLATSAISGECDEIKGYATGISFEEGKLKLEMESGGYDCDDQQYDKRVLYYVWSDEEEKLVREST